MALATKTNARAIFDHQSIEFFITDGVVDELNIAQGRVKFTGLDQVDQFASIKLLIKGPLRSSLALIDSKPFEFAKAVGINPKSLKGNTVTQLNLNFIVEKSLTADQVKFGVATTMNDVFFPDVVDGLALEAKKLVLVADKKAMEIKGLVKVGGLLADLEWREHFAASEAPRTRYRINGKINSRDLGSKLNLAGISDLMENIQGLIGAELEVNIDRAGKGSLTSRLDLTDATLKIPKTGWRKLPKIAALATVDFAFQDNAIKDKVAISMIGGGARGDSGPGGARRPGARTSPRRCTPRAPRRGGWPGGSVVGLTWPTKTISTTTCTRWPVGSGGCSPSCSPWTSGECRDGARRC